MAAVVHPRSAPALAPARRRVRVAPVATPYRAPAPAPARAVVPALTYRRRRAAAAGIVVALLMAVQGLLAVVGGGASDPAPTPLPLGPLSTYVVQPGDTFWSIAVRLEPGRDPRPLVDRLIADHGSAALVVGERIALPERR